MHKPLLHEPRSYFSKRFWLIFILGVVAILSFTKIQERQQSEELLGAGSDGKKPVSPKPESPKADGKKAVSPKPESPKADAASASATSPQAGPSGVQPPDVSGMSIKDSGDAAPSGKPVQCNDPTNGFEARVSPCGQLYYHSKQKPHYYSFQLTKSFSQIIYMVLDELAECAGPLCTPADTEACCSLRRKCNPGFIEDIPKGCSSGKVVNPYDGAYCKTIPCRADDAKICCIAESGELFQRTDRARSNRARIIPDEESTNFAEPNLSFRQNELAWLDMSQKKNIKGDDWAPLVNFMESWGPAFSWKTPAWIRITSDGREKYKEVDIKTLFPDGVIPGKSSANADERVL